MKKMNIPLMATLLVLSIIVCPILYFTVGPRLDATQLETLKILGIIAACSAAYCFIVGEATGNNSQMDKLWSLLPIAYTWIIAAKGGMSLRLVVMAVLATIWGIRLTYNFARKGAYRLKFWEGTEDYRWAIVRSGPAFRKRWAWALFDLGFISIYQNALVLMTTFPALVSMGSDKPFGLVDGIAATLMLGFIIWETVADEQQWAFQTKKWAMINAGQKLEDLPAPYNKGFNTTGLWSRSRHPNYFAEQGTWVAFYIFSIGAGMGILNWSIIGALLLIVLFQGSSSLAEEISGSKYPEYADYCRSVPRFFPGKKLSALPLLILTLVLAACQSQNPVLTVEGGKVQGVPAQTPGVMVFKGIPYAAAPVGELRWQSPQPVTPWEGVRVCDTFGPIAPQPGNKPGTFYGDEFYWEGTPEESEDCLYLNIWAPASTLGKPDSKLPVAMWIHGGAYMNGYGYEVTMDGEEWARRGVILVTINYRLGALGFLSHPELTEEQGQSGNYGTMDQIAALQWVSENIGAFGGDPSRITIFGQSAGAMSVKNLLVSPLSRDLIAGAIIQSGGGLGSRGLVSDGEITQATYDAQGKEVMDKAGLETLADLRAAAPETLLAAGGWFWPHLDGKVLTETFDEALFNGTMAQVPILIGYNKDDMAGLGGDSVDRFCAIRDSLGFPVYEYEFLRELPTDEAHPASRAGAFHSAELWYMFGTLDRSWRPFTEADHQLSEQMLDAWTAFCRNGDPGWPAFKYHAPCKKSFDI